MSLVVYIISRGRKLESPESESVSVDLRGSILSEEEKSMDSALGSHVRG